MWIVASNNFYYPDVAFFKSYEQAKEFYDETVKSCASSFESDELSIVIAEISQMATSEKDTPRSSRWYLFDERLIDKIQEEGKTGTKPEISFQLKKEYQASVREENYKASCELD